MKFQSILLLLLFSINHITYAQIGFKDQVIIDNTFTADDATSVFAADLDGDGDLFAF